MIWGKWGGGGKGRTGGKGRSSNALKFQLSLELKWVKALIDLNEVCSAYVARYKNAQMPCKLWYIRKSPLSTDDDKEYPCITYKHVNVKYIYGYIHSMYIGRQLTIRKSNITVGTYPATTYLRKGQPGMPRWGCREPSGLAGYLGTWAGRDR